MGVLGVMRPHTTSAVDQGCRVAKRVLAAEVWMVRYLGNVIGPISLELVEKGIQAGKLPRGTEIAHSELQRWRPLGELYPQLLAEPAETASPIETLPVSPEAERPSSLPPPAPPRSTRATFSARPYSSPPPRPVPVPASAPPPAAPRMVTAPRQEELPVVPPPPPVPPAPPPSYRFPEEPVHIPKQGVLAALFG